MCITINSYIESLCYSGERLRVLSGMHTVSDSTGKPVFSVINNYVQFEVLFDGAACVMSCSLTGTLDRAYSRDVMNCKIKGNPYIVPWDLYKHEMMVYDMSGQIRWADVLLQRRTEGVELHTWMRLNLFADNRRPWRALLKNLYKMASSLREDNISHGSLTPGNIIVDWRNSPTAFNYPLLGQRNEKYTDACLLGITSVVCYIAACQPEIVHRIGVYHMILPNSFMSYAKSIILQAEFSKNRVLSTLTELVIERLDNGTDNDGLIVEQIRLLSAARFEPMVLLADLIGVCREEDGLQCSECSVAGEVVPSPRNGALYALPEETARARVDFSECGYVGELQDTLILIREDDFWGYADSDGYYVIQPCFEDAGDFYEGRAAVRVRSGWGLIDRTAGFIMLPQYELLEWYGKWNVVAACIDGGWELYDRCGKQLTSGRYDWIGECSEGVMVAYRGDRYGYLRCDGSPLTDLKFDEAFAFSNGNGSVYLDGKLYHIGHNGLRR